MLRVWAARCKRDGAAECAGLQGRIALFDALRQAVETVTQAEMPVMIVAGSWNGSFDTAAAVLARLTHGRHLTDAT